MLAVSVNLAALHPRLAINFMQGCSEPDGAIAYGWFSARPLALGVSGPKATRTKFGGFRGRRRSAEPILVAPFICIYDYERLCRTV